MRNCVDLGEWAYWGRDGHGKEIGFGEGRACDDVDFDNEPQPAVSRLVRRLEAWRRDHSQTIGQEPILGIWPKASVNGPRV